AAGAVGRGVGPEVRGPSSRNGALRSLAAPFIRVALGGEPIGAALLALLLFGEWFAPLQFAGFVLLLAGIVAAARGERRRMEGAAMLQAPEVAAVPGIAD